MLAYHYTNGGDHHLMASWLYDAMWLGQEAYLQHMLTIKQTKTFEFLSRRRSQLHAIE